VPDFHAEPNFSQDAQMGVYPVKVFGRNFTGYSAAYNVNHTLSMFPTLVKK